MIRSPAAQQPSASSHCSPPDASEWDQQPDRANPHGQYEQEDFHGPLTGVTKEPFNQDRCLPAILSLL
jgi:hypothetical protein